MSNTKRDRDTLEKAFRQVTYELWMLEQTSRMLPSFPNLREPHDRAVLESFVIHTRNLLGFLYGREGNNYIVPEHFIDADVWRARRPEESKLLKDARIRANNDVAHLTYTRLENSKSNDPWPIPEITKQILEAYAEFVKLVQTEHPHLAPSQHQANVICVSSVARFTSTPPNQQAR